MMKLTFSVYFAELLLYLLPCHKFLLFDLTLRQYYEFLIEANQIFLVVYIFLVQFRMFFDFEVN